MLKLREETFHGHFAGARWFAHNSANSTHGSTSTRHLTNFDGAGV